MEKKTRVELKRLGLTALLIPVAIYSVFFLAVIATDPLNVMTWIVCGIFLSPVVIVVLAATDMWQSDQDDLDDLRDQFYGSGGSVGGLENHKRHPRKAIHYCMESDISRDRQKLSPARGPATHSSRTSDAGHSPN